MSFHGQQLHQDAFGRQTVEPSYLEGYGYDYSGGIQIATGMSVSNNISYEDLFSFVSQTHTTCNFYQSIHYIYTAYSLRVPGEAGANPG